MAWFEVFNHFERIIELKDGANTLNVPLMFCNLPAQELG